MVGTLTSNLHVLSLYGEYVVRFSLSNGVLYLVTTGWIFYISLLPGNSTTHMYSDSVSQ